MPSQQTSVLAVSIQHPIWSQQLFAAAESGMILKPFPQKWMELVQQTNIRNIRRKIYATSATPVLRLAIPANDNMQPLPRPAH